MNALASELRRVANDCEHRGRPDVDDCSSCREAVAFMRAAADRIDELERPQGDPLGEDERYFLTCVFNRLPLKPADRVQDSIRQRCRRKGLAVYSGGEWHVTPSGVEALGRRGGGR